MKKTLIALGILSLVVAVGLTIFVATFDVDRYRPQVVQAIQSAVGRPVRIEKLGLNFNGGISIQVKGFAIEPMIQADSISAALRLLPLLRRDLQMGSVAVVRPKIFVERRPDGTINLTELIPPPATQKTGSRPAQGGAALSFLIGVIRVEDGTIHVRDASQSKPLEATLEHVEVTIKNVSLPQPMNVEARAALAGGTVTAGATADHLMSQPRVNFHVAVEKVNVESLLPNAAPGGVNGAASDSRSHAPGQPAVRGRLSGSFEGALEGITPPQLLQSLTGKGTVNLSDGVIVNFNILREAFGRFSILPGLVETLLAQLPESYRQRLAAPDTVLKQSRFDLAVSGGTCALSDLRLETDTFDLTGSGQMNLQGAVNAQAVLRIEPQMSAAIGGIVKELRYLADDQGRIQFPVTIQGSAQQLTVLPDVGYLTSHLAGSAAEQLIGDLLQKVLKKKKRD